MLKQKTAIPRLAGLLIYFSGSIILPAVADVRAYPDPGYRLLGVYGSAGTDFDYTHRKLMLTDSPFPDKAAWWANLKDSASSDSANRHDIYLIYCGEREDTEIARKRIDDWLQPEPGIPTYPELIPAISLGEENVPSHREKLDELARYVRETYNIPVFQWYSDPLPPDPALTADGWIWDSYEMKRTAFRKHVMKFVVLRKPAVCVVWATDPHWTGWPRYGDTPAMIDAMWHQFDICREFNVPCVAFAVAGPGGSVGHWRTHATKDMDLLRTAMALQREGMNQLPTDSLPLISADYSARDRSVPIGGPPDAPGVYEETFTGFGWIHDADIRGFTHLELSSLPEAPPGHLDLVTAAEKPVTALLTYRFESFFPLAQAQVLLEAAAPGASRGENQLQVSSDGRTWQSLLTQQSSDNIEQLSCELPAWVQGRHDFLLRVALTNCGSRAGVIGNRLDRLRVSASWQPPPEGASATLVKDLYGTLYYDDDFSMARWRHLGLLTVSNPERGGYRNGTFWVGGMKGYPVTTRLVQRFASPQPLTELTVIVKGRANLPDLGGQLTLGVARPGAVPEWTVQSSGNHQGELQLTIPPAELVDLGAFDVHIVLCGNSGADLGESVAASVSELRIEAR